MIILALIVIAVVLSLLYVGISKIPFVQPYLWAVQAIFYVLAALAIAQLFFGGGLSALHLSV